MRSKTALALLLLGLALPAQGEIQLEKIQWQTVHWNKAKAAKPQDITELGLEPGKPLKGRLTAKLKLLNRGSAVEGILLRYTVTARIAPLSKREQLTWALPFMLDERRVPKAGANQYLDVTLDPTALVDLYLKKLHREGYWPEELKLQVMVEPRRDETGPLQVIEASLPLKK